MIAAQRDVLLTYLGADPGRPRATGPPVPGGVLPAELATGAPAGPPTATPLTAAARRWPARRRRAAGEPPGGRCVRRSLEIISERTGYPVDMIEPDLDLEADLSIDSIKRAEIAGELASRLGWRAARPRGPGRRASWRSWRRPVRPPP